MHGVRIASSLGGQTEMIDKWTQLSVDTCLDMWLDMCIGMCLGMYRGMYPGMYVSMCIDMRHVCMHVYTHVHRHVHGDASHWMGVGAHVRTWFQTGVQTCVRTGGCTCVYTYGTVMYVGCACLEVQAMKTAVVGRPRTKLC